ncbi:hypothetical protein SAMN02910370_02367 [Lachnospiraceae bacterium XPB1003]|nr:hypothetical protein SAMN02910370_02367 [Lachnospiraceae bacterium XPB1003]
MPHEIYLRSTLSVMRDVQSDLFAGDIGSRKSFLLSCIVADSGCGDTDSHYSQDKKSGCQKTSYQSDMHYTGDSCYGLLHYEAYSGFTGCKGRFREFPDLQGIFTRMIRQIGIFIPVCFLYLFGIDLTMFGKNYSASLIHIFSIEIIL